MMFSHVSNEETSSGDGLEAQILTNGYSNWWAGKEKVTLASNMAYFWYLCLISGLISVVSLIRCSTFDFNWRCSPYEHLRTSYETTPPQTNHSLFKRHQDREALAMRARARRRANWVSWLWRSTSNRENVSTVNDASRWWHKITRWWFQVLFFSRFREMINLDGLKPPTIYGVI